MGGQRVCPYMPYALGCWQARNSLLLASECHRERQIDKDYLPYASLNGCHKSLHLQTISVCSLVKIRPPSAPQQGAWVDAYVCLYQQPPPLCSLGAGSWWQVAGDAHSSAPAQLGAHRPAQPQFPLLYRKYGCF